MVIYDSMSVRPASAVISRRHRSSVEEGSSSTPQTSRSDISPLRTYTACGILGAWTKVMDSEGYEDTSSDNENIHQDSHWRNESVWSNPLESPHDSLNSPLPDNKFVSRTAFFESMQKASGEKVLSRLRERQMSLTSSSPHTVPPAIPQRTSHSTTPTPPRRSYPRKLQPLPHYNEPPWSPI